MRIGKITGTITATAKDAQLVGSKMMILNIIDSQEKVLERAVVAIDCCGAGIGDTVLISFGSSARLSAGAIGLPTDAAIIAIIEHISNS